MNMKWRNFRPVSKVAAVLGGLVLAAGLAFLFGLIVMLLWNWLMPAIFGLGTITYWQGWGIVLLAHILFKAGPGHHNSHRDRRRDNRDKWKTKFRARFETRDNGPEKAQDTADETGPEGTSPEEG